MAGARRRLHAGMGTGSGGLGTTAQARTQTRTRNRYGQNGGGGLTNSGLNDTAGSGSMVQNQNQYQNRGFNDAANEDWGNRRLAFEDQGWTPGAGNPFQDSFEPIDFDQLRQQHQMRQGNGPENAWHNGQWQNAMSDWRADRPAPPRDRISI